MNGLPRTADFRRPVLAGRGFFVLAFMPPAVFFPLLFLPLLLSMALLIGAGPIRAVFASSCARPGRASGGLSSFRAPPLV